MLTEICQYLRNWFTREILASEFSILDNEITFKDGTALPLLPGQYFRIVGSTFNDGIFKYGQDELVNEEFSGAVWTMAVPPLVVELDAEITSWVADNAEVLNSPYQSESFGGYSYSLKDGGSGADGVGGVKWQTHFSARLAPWRKI